MAPIPSDTNVQTAMDAALSANMAEGMEGYFRMIETFLPDWRINAQKLFGARGVLGQIVAITKYWSALSLCPQLDMEFLDTGEQGGSPAISTTITVSRVTKIFWQNGRYH